MMAKPHTNDVETVELTPDQLKARSRRNLWLALAIGAFVLLVFLITMTKLQAGLHQ